MNPGHTCPPPPGTVWACAGTAPMTVGPSRRPTWASHSPRPRPQWSRPSPRAWPASSVCPWSSGEAAGPTGGGWPISQPGPLIPTPAPQGRPLLPRHVLQRLQVHGPVQPDPVCLRPDPVHGGCPRRARARTLCGRVRGLAGSGIAGVVSDPTLPLSGCVARSLLSLRGRAGTRG